MPTTSTKSISKITGKIYTRLSRDEEGQTSTADQERECRRLADRLGITDIKVYGEEPGTSGFKDVARPVFDDLLANLSSSDVVLAWSLDRLTRKGIVQAAKILERLEKTGARLLTVSDGIDTSTDHADIIVAVTASGGQKYSKQLSKNVRRGKETGAVAGKWGGGQRWYGYATDAAGIWRGPTTIDHAEAKVLREIRQRYVEGESFSAIARDLNQRGIPTVQGAQWQPHNIPRLVFNKRYAGVRVHHGAEYPAAWPAIFTMAEHAELQTARMVAERMKKWPSKPGGARTYLLTGFLHCPCGGRPRGNLRETRNGTKQRRYRCPACNGGARIADPLEHFITEALMFRYDTPDFGKLLQHSNASNDVIHSLTSELEAVSLKQQQLDDYFFNPQPGEPALSRAQYARQSMALQAAQEAAESHLRAEMEKRTGIKLEAGQRLRDAWQTWDLAKRRQLVRLAIVKVVLKPSNTGGMKPADYYLGKWRFKPSDIAIEWADQETGAQFTTPIKIADPANQAAAAALLR